jgi:hypothetical protein
LQKEENRMVALLTGNSRDATIFIEGKDVHQVKENN